MPSAVAAFDQPSWCMSSTVRMPWAFAQPTACFTFVRYSASSSPCSGSSADHERFRRTTLKPYAAMSAKSASESGRVTGTSARAW